MIKQRRIPTQGNKEMIGEEIMKTLSFLMLGGLMVLLTGCELTGPSVKVKGPEVKIPGVEVGIQGGGKFCPPGQAKKGRC